MKRDYLYLALLGLIPLLYLTGGAESPLRFLYYPIMISFIPVINKALHLQAGIAFSVLYSLLPLVDGSPYPTSVIGINDLSFLLVSLASGNISEMLRREKESFKKASESYHGLTNALNLSIMNLQSKIDSLTETQERTQESEKNKTRFISGVSHEIRSPLAAIRSFSEILLNYRDIDEDTRREFLGIINSESVRLTELANEILDMTRIESGRVEWHMNTIDMGDVIRTAIKTIQPLASDKGLSLQAELPDAPVRVKGDRDKLLQVLLNLLSNAVKFTSKGSITVGVKDTSKELEVRVSDTGEGIYPEEKEKIFEEFFRIGDSLAGRPKGSGLGLSISKKIIEGHGGGIWMESEIGKGSVFHFTIPKETLAFVGEKARPALEIRGKQILVVEDHSPMRQILRGSLEGVGYKTLGVESVRAALEMLRAKPPDAVVMGFPEGDGSFDQFKSFSRIRGIPLFLVSIINEEKTGPQVAVNGFVSKPYDAFQTVAALEDILGGRSNSLLIISEDPEEARGFQFLVGSRGYETEIVSDPSAIDASRPHGLIVLGTFPKNNTYRIIEALRTNSGLRKLPILQTVNINIRDIKCVSLSSSEYGSGLSRLTESLQEAIRDVSNI